MNDRLEDFVRDHRDEFDMLEPDLELWQGVEKKMKRGRKHTFRYYLSRTAAVAAIFVLSLFAQKYIFKHDVTKNIPELAEAEHYYSGLINAKLEEVKPFLSEFPDIKTELDNDLGELDSVYSSLRNDLKDNVANQEVIEAMIENYRLRIDILEEMLQFLGKNDEDNTDHDNSLDV